MHSEGARVWSWVSTDWQAVLVHMMAISASVGVASDVTVYPESEAHVVVSDEVRSVWSDVTSHEAALVAATRAAAVATAANFMVEMEVVAA